MKKITYPLILAVLVSLILASCGLLDNNNEAAESDLPDLQATAIVPTAAVAVELTGQVDTTIPYNTVGQVMKFKFSAKMTRNDLTDATPLALTFTGATPVCPAVNTVGNLNDRLDTGEIIDCSFDYILTQADLDRGTVALAVTVNIYGVNSNTYTINVPTVPAKLLTLTVSAAPTTYSAAGQTITITYAIKNSGSSQLGPDQFKISNPLVGTTLIDCGPANSVIAPGTSLTCSSTYTTTAADASAAAIAITNITASGGGANPSPQVPLTITKGAAPTYATGATVQHTVVVGEWLWQIARCYGADPKKTVEANKQLADPAKIKEGMVVTVPNIGSNGKIYAPQKCVDTYVVQSGDTWSSIATKFGADTALLQMVNANTLTVGSTIKIPLYTAGLNAQPSTSALVLTISTVPTTYSQVNQIIAFNYLIKNNGTTTLGPDQFKVNDPLISASAFNCGPAGTTLAPGATTTCSANYTITQADANSSAVSTNAIATGGGLTSAKAPATITRGTTQLSLTATANPTTYSQIGQIITLSYVIKNNGTTTLGPAQFTVTDGLISQTPINCGANNVTLAPNATVNCQANYTINQVDMGSVAINTKPTAGGGGAPQSAPVDVNILRSVSSLSLVSTPNPTTYNQLGQVITFNYVITNNGTATLGPAQFTVTDVLIGPAAFNCGAPNTTLAPNATVNCQANYTITQADMSSAAITNSATAAGGGAATTQPDVKTLTKQ